MRTIPAGITAELAKAQWTEFTAIKMTIATEDYCYTDADTPFVLDGDRYEPRGFRFSPASYSKANIVTRANVEMENLDQIFTSLFVGSVVQGSDVVAKKVMLPDDLTPVGVTIFEGTIDDWQLDEETVTITVASVLQRWSQRTMSNYSPSCRWKQFKGTECGYTGGATACDRSYQRCVDLGNQDNFGGFRWSPSIQDKEIWWGQKPAT